jgi:diguanylate cyclase (GGDEF)-like protein
VALLYLDLDEFKNVNDTLGHMVGDELLKAAASRLDEQVREVDSVARLGGDEFAIILTGIKGAAGVSTFALRILDSLSRSFNVAGHVIHTSASIGISVSSADSEPAELMLQADRALYKAKERGRSNFQFHDDKLADEVERYVQIREDLHGAVERGEFFLEFQPQVNLESGDIIGCEALVRWQHPRRGLLYPSAFIPVTENTSLIVPLGSWVLEEACRQCGEWCDRGRPDFAVAVNLSAVQFRDPRFIATLDSILARTDLAPQSLELELTETVLMQSSEEVGQALRASSERGISFAIDDFGTGYSSLRYLREFPVHKLKIAMEFVQGVSDDEDDAAIVEAVISLGRKLGITVIAEGVETAEQADFLLRHGCEEAQGFYFGRPLRPEAFAALLDAGQS